MYIKASPYYSSQYLLALIFFTELYLGAFSREGLHVNQNNAGFHNPSLLYLNNLYKSFINKGLSEFWLFPASTVHLRDEDLCVSDSGI